MSLAATVIVGLGSFRYEVHERWEKLPEGWSFVEVTAVATDSQDRVYVFNRGEHPVVIFDRDGNVLGSWGEGMFVRPHGITIGPDETVYCTDDLDHTVKIFTLDGTPLRTLGTSGRPSDTGATSIDFRTIRHAGPPFHYPTNLALAPSGEMYITDGYGNARVHKFASDGRLLTSWGEPGSGPGQFHVPHGIAVDRQGTVFVADRENSRLQLFGPDGDFLSEWTDLARPCQVFLDADDNVYVAELGYRAGMWPGTTAPSPDSPGGRVSIFDRDRRVALPLGRRRQPLRPGRLLRPPRHLARLAGRPLRLRSDHVRRRQSRARPEPLPHAPEVHPPRRQP